MQGQIVPLFHYALRPDGYLFLGSSENVTRHTRLFATVDKANRIFRRVNHSGRKMIEFPLAPSPARRPQPASAASTQPGQTTLMELAERQILGQLRTGFVVINADGEVLQSSGGTGKYLELPIGAPDTNIFNLARRDLPMELRAAFHKAVASGQSVTQGNIAIGTNGGRKRSI